MTQRIFIIGACSAIATELAREYAKQGAHFCLLARNQQKLDVLCADLTARGAAQTESIVADVSLIADHQAHLQQAQQMLGEIDLAVIAHGTLADQQACEASAELTLAEINVNGVASVNLMALLADYFAQQQRGSLAVISSVAGDRGRASNYVYGAAKALVSTFAEGLVGRFANSDVHVLLIKPGFVDTPMTAAFKKGALWAQPDAVAQAIIKALNKRKNILYVPLFWWPIMQIIKLIPTFIFKKLPL